MMSKLTSVGFDAESDLLLLKMVHPALCRLSEDDRMRYRVQLIEILRKFLSPRRTEGEGAENVTADANNEEPPKKKKVKIEPKRSVETSDDVIILDD